MLTTTFFFAFFLSISWIIYIAAYIQTHLIGMTIASLGLTDLAIYTGISLFPIFVIWSVWGYIYQFMQARSFQKQMNILTLQLKQGHEYSDMIARILIQLGTNASNEFVVNKIDLFLGEMNEILADILTRYKLISDEHIDRIWSEVQKGNKWGFAKAIINLKNSVSDFDSKLIEAAQKKALLAGTISEFCARYTRLIELLKAHDKERIFLDVIETGAFGRVFAVFAPIHDYIYGIDKTAEIDMPGENKVTEEKIELNLKNVEIKKDYPASEEQKTPNFETTDLPEAKLEVNRELTASIPLAATTIKEASNAEDPIVEAIEASLPTDNHLGSEMETALDNPPVKEDLIAPQRTKTEDDAENEKLDINETSNENNQSGNALTSIEQELAEVTAVIDKLSETKEAIAEAINQEELEAEIEEIEQIAKVEENGLKINELLTETAESSSELQAAAEAILNESVAEILPNSIEDLDVTDIKTEMINQEGVENASYLKFESIEKAETTLSEPDNSIIDNSEQFEQNPEIIQMDKTDDNLVTKEDILDNMAETPKVEVPQPQQSETVNEDNNEVEQEEGFFSQQDKRIYKEAQEDDEYDDDDEEDYEDIDPYEAPRKKSFFPNLPKLGELFRRKKEEEELAKLEKQYCEIDPLTIALERSFGKLSDPESLNLDEFMSTKPTDDKFAFANTDKTLKNLQQEWEKMKQAEQIGEKDDEINLKSSESKQKKDEDVPSFLISDD